MSPTGPVRPADPSRGPRNGLGTATFAVVVLAALLAVVPATAALGFLLCLLALVPAALAHRRARRGVATNRKQSAAAVLMAPTFLVVALVVGATAPPQVQTASDTTALRDTPTPAVASAGVAPLVAAPAPTSTGGPASPADPASPAAPTSRVAAADRPVSKTTTRTSSPAAPRAARVADASPRISTTTAARVAAPKPAVERVVARPSSPSAKAPATTSSKPAPSTSRATACDEDTHYVNAKGTCVLRPVAGPVAPAGATAKCQDGTYSSSQSRSGTCSRHGGVAQWL